VVEFWILDFGFWVWVCVWVCETLDFIFFGMGKLVWFSGLSFSLRISRYYGIYRYHAKPVRPSKEIDYRKSK